MTIEQLILSEINKKGSISVDEFIHLCQFEEEGYYLKNVPIGSKYDFITAPEISQMFGEILTLFIINYWKENINKKFNLVELGPGKGTLLKDLLRTASKNQKFLNDANLILIEKNKNLIDIQKDNVNFNNSYWSKEFNIPNKNIPSIIYSNEFFDCFPVKQFHKKDNWYEKFIEYNYFEKNYKFISKKITDINLLKSLEKFNNVKVAEISKSRSNYFNIICKFIKKYKGLFITIDYGYKDPPKHLSLQTIYNHKKTHLFENIGNQDITTHVDFDELILLANQNDLSIDLFCSQRDFLINHGIKERKKKLEENQSEKIKNNLRLQYERLVNKTQMGEIFKVLVISCL